MKVTGSNGNSIFLPPTGYKLPASGVLGSAQLVNESDGYYWVGESYHDASGKFGYTFYFDNESYYYNGSWNTSFIMMAVRAVKE